MSVHAKNITSVIEPDHEAVVPHGSGKAHVATGYGPDARSGVDSDVNPPMNVGVNPVPSDPEGLDHRTFDGPTGQAAGGHTHHE